LKPVNSKGLGQFWHSGGCRIADGDVPVYDRCMASETSPSYRYIVRSPDVRGGRARVEGTRIAVHDVIGLLQTGESIESLTTTVFPMLTKAQVYECLAFYEDHRGEVDLLVAQQMATTPEAR
jgi:uncharacterized protein (DUF433 family)